MNINRITIEDNEEYLRQISQEAIFNDELKEEINKLKIFCENNECFALAAVQIGIPKRIIYLKNTTLDIPLDNIEYNEGSVLINPRIISCKGKTQFWEACLSCLDNMGLVIRPYEIELEYYTENVEKITKKFEGFESTVLSHELDHLDGILHMDIAEEVIQMPKEERKKFREKNGYKVLSKTAKYVRKI